MNEFVNKPLELVTQTLTAQRTERSPRDIQEMFNLETFSRLGTFTPHPETDDVTAMTIDWVDELGFLKGDNLDQIKAWATMTGYAHQGERAIIDLDAYVYGAIYLMDDWLANDAQKIQLTPEQKLVLKDFIAIAIQALMKAESGMDVKQITVDFERLIPQAETPEMLEFFRKTALLFKECWRLVTEVEKHTDAEFVRGYAQVLRQHLIAGLNDQDEAILENLDLDNYLDVRIEVAGMKVGRKLVEMTTQSYEGLRALHKSAEEQPTPTNTRIAQLIQAMEKDTDDFGCVGNDIFSIIKEVFRDKTIFNFIAIAILSTAQSDEESTSNFFELSEKALEITRQRVHQITDSFVNRYLGDTQGSPSLAEEINQLQESDLPVTEGLTTEEIKQQLNDYAAGLVQYFLATYHWELDPQGGLLRYQRPDAIFEQLLTQGLIS